MYQEMQHLQKRSSSQVTELQALAEEQFNRANKLSDELTRIKTKKQVSLLDRVATVRERIPYLFGFKRGFSPL